MRSPCRQGLAAHRTQTTCPAGPRPQSPRARHGKWAKQGLGPLPAPEPLHALAADRVPVAASSCPVTGYTKGDTFPQRPLNLASKAGGK